MTGLFLGDGRGGMTGWFLLGDRREGVEEELEEEADCLYLMALCSFRGEIE